MQRREESDIYYTREKLERMLERLKEMPNGEKGIEFLTHLQASGLSSIRVLRYAQSLPKILESMDVQTAGRKEVESFVGELNRSTYRIWTKHGYKLTLKKFFQFLRSGSVSRDIPYPQEVSWIRLNVSLAEAEKESRVTPDKLLSSDDIVAMMKAARNPRDEALISVLFEGAFRPGELLSMRVGSVQFLQDYCVVSTKGKTGQKRIPLVTSFRPLAKWLSVHPFRGDASAALWCALDKGHTGEGLSYPHFRLIVRGSAKRAGVKKEVWPYLFRHTQLTSMADKLTDSKLSLFAGWTLGTKMSRRYVHWSGRDLDRSVLAIYGLSRDAAQDEASQIVLVECPRCTLKNSPSSPRCERCGLILDRKLALDVEDDVARRIEKLESLVRSFLGGASGAGEA